jgi:hypothetical protein
MSTFSNGVFNTVRQVAHFIGKILLHLFLLKTDLPGVAV